MGLRQKKKNKNYNMAFLINDSQKLVTNTKKLICGKTKKKLPEENKIKLLKLNLVKLELLFVGVLYSLNLLKKIK